MNPNSFLTPSSVKATAAAPAEKLDPIGSWPATKHLWEQRELDALALAVASGRPLLIRGEPGTGKSQIARAAAARLKWEFQYEVITARHEAQDLLWRYDAVERLATAQKAASSAMKDFVTPGRLWWALNPPGAARQAKHAKQPATQTVSAGTVVLLDEIDKADTDFPNSLLEVLANRGFSLPWGEPLFGEKEQAAPVLVIITSNEERELPSAFVRRCVCLHLLPPRDDDPSAFHKWLTDRGAVRYPDVGTAVQQLAAEQVLKDRKECPEGTGARPGLAEFLDLLHALHDIAPNDAAAQGEWLERLSPYALIKQYPNPQERTPKAGSAQS